jgi:urate oxidase
MKNFVYAMVAEYSGRTLPGLCAFLGRSFLETYPVMEALRVTAREVPLDAAPGERGLSDVLFRSTRTEGAVAQIAVDAVGGKPEITAARSGWEGMALVKTTGSSFATFARDDYTTLPELTDRPLTIRMDMYWRYGDLRDGVAEGPGFLGARAVRDEVERIFHEFNSRSIQHLVHEIGARLFAAHGQLQEIEFVAENHTPDHVRDGAGGVRVFAEPRATFGKIGLVLKR